MGPRVKPISVTLPLMMGGGVATLGVAELSDDGFANLIVSTDFISGSIRVKSVDLVSFASGIISQHLDRRETDHG